MHLRRDHTIAWDPKHVINVTPRLAWVTVRVREESGRGPRTAPDRGKVTNAPPMGGGPSRLQHHTLELNAGDVMAAPPQDGIDEDYGGGDPNGLAL